MVQILSLTTILVLSVLCPGRRSDGLRCGSRIMTARIYQLSRLSLLARLTEGFSSFVGGIFQECPVIIVLKASFTLGCGGIPPNIKQFLRSLANIDDGLGREKREQLIPTGVVSILILVVAADCVTARGDGTASVS